MPRLLSNREDSLTTDVGKSTEDDYGKAREIKTVISDSKRGGQLFYSNKNNEQPLFIRLDQPMPGEQSETTQGTPQGTVNGPPGVVIPKMGYYGISEGDIPKLVEKAQSEKSINSILSEESLLTEYVCDMSYLSYPHQVCTS